MSKRGQSPSPPGRGARGEGASYGAPTRKPALPADIKVFARNLRGSQTDAENLFWYLLRDRRFLGLKFRRQHPVPPYVLDFYCEELRLAIELDGGQHNDPEGIERDRERDIFLARHNIRVLRYWNDDVLTRLEDVLEHLWAAVASEGPSPGPSGRPLPVGEGNRAGVS